MKTGLNDKTQSIFVLIGLSLLSLGIVNITHSIIGVLLAIIGILTLGVHELIGAKISPNQAGLSDKTQAILYGLSFILISIGGVAVLKNYEWGYIVIALGVFGGALNQWFGSQPSAKPKLTPKEQSLLVMLSSILVTIGAITVPSDELTGVIIMIIGAIGVGIKEYLGAIDGNIQGGVIS